MARVIPSDYAGMVNTENAYRVLLADILKNYIDELTPQLNADRVNQIGEFIQTNIEHLPPDQQKPLAPFKEC